MVFLDRNVEALAIVMSEVPHAHTIGQHKTKTVFSTGLGLGSDSIFYHDKSCQLLTETTSIMASTSLAGWGADEQTVTFRPDVCTASDVVGPIVAICICGGADHTHARTHTRMHIHTLVFPRKSGRASNTLFTPDGENSTVHSGHPYS